MATDSFDPFAIAIEATSPSTEPQREIWTATRVSDEASLAFNESTSLHLRGPLHVEALRAALAGVVARHDALRATFSDDGLTMIIGEAPASVDLPIHDWSDWSEPEYAAHLAALQKRAVEVPFSLEQGPLVRFELARRSADAHVLTITAHHIVCDGWSTGVIVTELAALYTGHLRGEAAAAMAALPPADRFTAYADAMAAGPSEEHRAASAYWIRQFGGDLPVLELPTDRTRPVLRSYESEREDHVLPAPLITALRRAAGREGASLFAAMLAGFGALLHRLTQQDDLVVGVPVAGQAAGYPTLVGHCVNMLPIRMRGFEQQEPLPFSAFVRTVRSTLLDAQEHQQLSFGSLLQLLPIARDPGRSPLVSVVFNLDKGIGPERMPFSGLTADLRANARSFESFELFMNAVELEGAVTLEVQYNRELFDRATIRRWLHLYQRLLELVAEPAGMATDIRELPLLTGADRAELDAVHGLVQPLPSQPLVHRLVAQQCAATPNAVAVQFEGRTLTYGELDAQADRLARKLRALGVGRATPVGLCVERSFDMLVAQQAILRAGGAYVPLDPDYPADRLAFMIADSAMRVVVAQESTRAQVPGDVRILSVDDVNGTDEMPGGPWNAEADAEPESPAYIIYTSGSTGRPKGVLVPHRALVNLLLSVQHSPGIAAADVVLAITTLSFDIAASELVLPLTVGARIVLASREVAADGLRLRELIESAGVTFIDATPASYRLLLAADWHGHSALTVICTGEAMPRDIAVALCDRAHAVWNGYGPTETTVWSTFYRVTKPVTRILIGRPVANTRVYVLDARRQPVPFGVRGELYIGGAGVASGYLHRPELTATRFLDDPFVTDPAARLYRTGDVVRLLASGDLEYLGRNDHQVKLRGFRIELGEIEDALLRHPRVRQAAVIVREDRPGDPRLVAYVALDTANPADRVPDAVLRSHVKQTLPDYMTPQAFVTVPALPLTPSGKIDRKSLPAPDQTSGGDDFVAPRSAAERVLAALWGDALGIGRMSVRDDVFALGAHSLLASQVLARLRRDHGVTLPFRKIFEAPTIEQFALLVEVQQAEAPTPPTAQAALPRRARAESAPLSIMQERLWLLEQLEPRQRAVHNLGVAWKLTGALDPSVLQAALSDFVQRHAAMRTSIHVVDGEPRQVIQDRADIPLELLDFSSIANPEREAALDAFMHAQEETPFDLAVAPLMRAWLIRISDMEHVFFSVRHNIVWDGWSFDLFLRDITEAYTALVDGRAGSFVPAVIEYADFAAWQRDTLNGPDMAAQVEFWRGQLQEMPAPLALPADHARPSKPTYRGGRVTAELDAAEVAALNALARDQGATLFMVLYAAYVVLLYRWSGQTDLIVGTPTRARTRPEMEDVVGPFVNTLAIRLTLDQAMPFADALRRVRDITLDSFGRQDMPFELLGTKPPIVRALFSLQDARTRAVRMGGVTVTQLHTPYRVATNDLMLWIMERRDGMLLALNYNADLFEAATGERFLAQFQATLRSVLRNVTEPIDAIDILPHEERAIVTEGAVDLGNGDRAEVAHDFRLGTRLGAGDVVLCAVPLAPEIEADLRTAGIQLKIIAADADDDVVVRALADSGAAMLIASEARWRAVVELGWTGGKGFRAVLVDAPVSASGLSWLTGSTPTLFTIFADEDLGGWLALAEIEPGSMVTRLGRPLGGTRLFVLDSSGNPAPIGIPGWLHVGGVAPSDPAGTYGCVTRDFLPEGSIVYATRDRARRMEGGMFELVEADAARPWVDGRRVMQADVDRVIAENPAVADAVSVVRRDSSGRTRHVAYVVWHEGELGDANELRHELRRMLPPRLVPQLVIEVDRIARTSGRVDRSALPWPYEAATAEYVAPATDAERLLAAAWQEALGVDRVSVGDNFFDLGGYSLLAFRMIGKLATESGARLNPRALLLGTLRQAAAELVMTTPVDRTHTTNDGPLQRLRGVISSTP